MAIRPKKTPNSSAKTHGPRTRPAGRSARDSAERGVAQLLGDPFPDFGGHELALDDGRPFLEEEGNDPVLDTQSARENPPVEAGHPSVERVGAPAELGRGGIPVGERLRGLVAGSVTERARLLLVA